MFSVAFLSQNQFKVIMDLNFLNDQLKSYLLHQGIDHIRGSPYHPQSQEAV